MFRYFLRRFYQMFVVLFVVSVLVFIIMSLTGDPVYMLVPLDSKPEAIEQARRALGLDKPMIVQYLIFLKNVLRGNFGISFVFGQPAMRLILPAIALSLQTLAMLIRLSRAGYSSIGVLSMHDVQDEDEI
jgi:peptide/nickel transport system permease protein